MTPIEQVLLQTCIDAVLVAVAAYKAFGSAYFTEKGKAAATKEDIEEITAKVESVKNDLSFSDQLRINVRAEERAALIDFYEKINTWYLEISSLDNDIITPVRPFIPDSVITTQHLQAMQDKLDLIMNTPIENSVITAKFKIDLYLSKEENSDIRRQVHEIIVNIRAIGTVLIKLYTQYYPRMHNLSIMLRAVKDSSYNKNADAAIANVVEAIDNYYQQMNIKHREFHEILKLLRESFHDRLTK